MVYVTGDTHIPYDIHKLSVTLFPEQKQLTRDDYVIICGDFGGVWNNSKEELYWRKWLNDKPFTTLFVDGNHENFPLLYQFPEREFCGGKVHEIMPNVLHLERGEIFCLDGASYFCMGGASSHDMWCRKEGVNWWPDEMPTLSEMEYAMQKIDDAGWKVDYIITHSAPKSALPKMASHYENDSITSFLQMIEERSEFKHWYFGHYHTDMDLDERHSVLYQRIIPIPPGGSGNA